MFDGNPAGQFQPNARSQGVAWKRASHHTLARIDVTSPDPRSWRSFLDELRPAVRPLILWMRGRVWLGADSRAALAHAIGSSRVALVVEDDIGRGLATALRWLGVEVSTYSLAELDQLETELEFEHGALHGQLGELN